MCIAYEEAYVGCNHVKATVFIERCEDAEGDGCSGAGITVIWIKQLSEPYLCVDCYRSYEIGIFAEYEANIAYHNSEIQCLGESLKNALNVSTHDLLRVSIAEHEKTRNINIGQRNKRLQLFREEQGVWGDG
jgi:uncharacterized protein YqkB